MIQPRSRPAYGTIEDDRLPRLDRSLFTQAEESYTLMENQIAALTEKNRQLTVQNHLLTAENGMLREALGKAEKDAKRLQAVASTFGGQARALQAVFGSIVELAIKNGYEAAEATETAQEPVQKPEPYEPPDTGRDATASGAPPAVDWSSIPR